MMIVSTNRITVRAETEKITGAPDLAYHPFLQTIREMEARTRKVLILTGIEEAVWINLE
jgi:hypothetical protein